MSEIPDFTSQAWQTRHDDVPLVVSILEGTGAGMPAFGGEVSEKQARQLLAYIRTFGPKLVKREEASTDDFEPRFHKLEEQFKELTQQSQTLAEARQAVDSPAASPTSREMPPTSGLFQKHCEKCHGADGTGSRARALLSTIPDFTETRWQGQRTDAQLLKSILGGKESEMPAFREKISDEQARDLVARVRGFGRTQKAQGSPPPGQSAGGSHSQGPLPEATESETEKLLHEKSFVQKLVGWLGRFHPSTVHFPIALLLAAGVAELLLLITHRPPFDTASRFCIWFGALTAPPVATLGWFFGGEHLTDPDWIMTAHRWLGTLTAACAVATLLLSEISRRPGRPARLGFRLVLLLNAVLVLVTGFFGGGLIHGLDYYTWPP